MTLDQFVQTYYGQPLTNNHGQFLGECVSLAARYAQEVQGIANGDGAMYCNNTGGARDLWEQYGNNNATQFYDQASSPQYGDIVVWGSNMGQYGDVAVYIGSGQVFGQLGTPVFIPAAARQLTPTPLGYLRRKGGNMPSSQTPADEVTVRLEYNNALFRDATPAEVQGIVGQTVEAVQRTLGGSPEHADLLGKNALGAQARKLLGNDVSPQNMEQKMIAKYGGSGEYTKVTDLYIKK